MYTIVGEEGKDLGGDALSGRQRKAKAGPGLLIRTDKGEVGCFGEQVKDLLLDVSMYGHDKPIM